MKLLDTLTVPSHHGEHRIELYHGDLAQIPADKSCDVLVVSAFPDNYRATRGTLIRALREQGLSVANLAQNKAIDLRTSAGCWLSESLTERNPDIGFQRLLCYEPLTRGHPSETIGDLFRALMPFVQDEPFIKTIAMPLVATGNQRYSMLSVLESLLDAAVNWLRLGLPIEALRIVEIQERKAYEMKGAFAVLKQQYTSDNPQPVRSHPYQYDYFVSYSRRNLDAAEVLIDALQAAQPDARIFFDQQTLKTGVAWQRELFQALDDCRKVITLLSPDYLHSKVCNEEYNIALLRHRESSEGVLLPIYLQSADLPGYMRLHQFYDCREYDLDALRERAVGIARA